MNNPAEYQPWYSDPANAHPYTLHRTIKSKPQDFRGLSPFPWDKDSLSTLWKGSFYSDDNQRDWLRYVSAYWDAVAVGSNEYLHIVFTQSARPPITFKIISANQTLIDADKPCVSWTMKMSIPFEPLVLYSYGSILHIFNVAKKGFEGYQRAHGGAITSIAVHPATPDYFATTSRDHTTRIYDLRLPAVLPVHPHTRNARGRKEYNPNPHWPPGKNPSLAGAAHGLRLHPNEIEGFGPGRCVAVLMGGRSGGHNAAVLHAAFHPSFPLIATCGMDRAVKIWPFRPDDPERIKREDKPFFSSSKIHKARVLSVNWLSSDVLITHSATAMNRITPKDPENKAIYLEAGELTIWTWLSLDRFFPPEFEGRGLDTARPISSDYQESSSFKLISTHAFPPQHNHIIAPTLGVFHSPTHDPLITFVYPNAPHFTMLNPVHMKPRQVPDFPYPELNRYPADGPTEGGGGDGEGEEERDQEPEEEDDGDDAPPNPRLDKGKGKEKETVPWNSDYSAKFVPHDGDKPEVISEPIRRRVGATPPPIEGWRVELREDNSNQQAGSESERRRLMNVAVTGGGRMIVGVGTQGSIWVWRCDN
ncbi:hypothetical protein D9619_003501 [Psilocybe cf. subviscida]|uniref:WD40 repeat-like protein n=1 Tax=Psilocybe cf. subviscida TaxID=2480587 RepID=A0A8H5AX84_9AGAR|nr:hypothetical protein D9619_003501 [Psilocybe cf. subviscida]